MERLGPAPEPEEPGVLLGGVVCGHCHGPVYFETCREPGHDWAVASECQRCGARYDIEGACQACVEGKS